MFSKIAVASSLLASAMAVPGTLRPRGVGPDNCDAVATDGTNSCYVADLAFYSDHDCTQQIGYRCVYGEHDGPDCTDVPPSGEYFCEAGDLPATTPFYAKVLDSKYTDVQIALTEDQSCPPSGAGAVFATLTDDARCVEINLGGSAPGISVYPSGGASFSKRSFNESSLRARDDTKCKGFNVDSQENSESGSVQVSVIVDCTNGGDTDCSITKGDQMTKSVTTSYSLTAGGGIEGIFEASATFGMDYTDSSTTSIQEDLTVESGQKGYLSAYSSATLFHGSFTGCDQGDDTQPGSTLAIKANGFTYIVVNTGAS